MGKKHERRKNTVDEASVAFQLPKNWDDMSQEEKDNFTNQVLDNLDEASRWLGHKSEGDDATG